MTFEKYFTSLYLVDMLLGLKWVEKKNITSIIKQFYYQIQFKNRLKFWKKMHKDLVDKLIASQIINSLHYISLEVFKSYFQKLKFRKVFTFKNI